MNPCILHSFYYSSKNVFLSTGVCIPGSLGVTKGLKSSPGSDPPPCFAQGKVMHLGAAWACGGWG